MKILTAIITKPEGLTPLKLPDDWLVGKHTLEINSRVVGWIDDPILAKRIVELLKKDEQGNLRRE